MTDVQPALNERTHRWEDPAGMAAAAGMDGLSVMRAVLSGELPAPPIAGLLGFELESVDEGRAVFTLEPGDYHYNPLGSVHGGVYATLLDSALGCAVHTTLPAGVRYTSLDLDVKFLRRITTDTGLVRATGWVVHGGRSTALARADLRDEAGRLLAEGSSSCIIFR